MIENIWEGIYDSFDQCPSHGPGFESDRWTRQETDRIHNLLRPEKNAGTISSAQ